MLLAQLSDLHLGRKSPGDPHGAERLSSFRQALAKLAQFQPDVLVIAGDTFDSPQVDQSFVEQAAQSMSGIKNDKGDVIPVVLIPGNHDPADADKLWSAFQKALGPSSGVHLILAPQLIPLVEGKVLVEAYPCGTRFSAEAPWAKRLPLNKVAGAVHVIVAHGTLQGGPVPEGETDAYPFTQSDLEALGADYVALGHFHGLYPAWGNGEECERSFSYCGTHEAAEFGGDSGNAILATLKPGQPPQLRRITTGRRQWRLLKLARTADLDGVERLLEEMKAGGAPGLYVVRLKIASGAGWSPEEMARLQKLEGAMQTLGASIERKGDMRPRVDVAALDLQGLPSGAIKEAMLSLAGDLQQEKDDSRREVLAAALQVGWEKLQEAT